MDSARLGRVLGKGARGAARTLVSAVDAATAPSTSQPPRATSAAPPRSTASPPSLIQPRHPATASPAAAGGQRRPPPGTPPRVQTASQPRPRPTAANLAEGSRRFGQATWSPIARLSGVLWLEFTGVFFGIFALSAATGAWRLRTAFQTTAPGNPARAHLILLLAVAAVFAWFCASSFLRARRRGRRA